MEVGGTMFRYVVRRLILMVPTLIGVALITFLIMRIIPGDIALLALGGDIGVVDPQQLEDMRETLGLNHPLYVQFVNWLRDAVRLDFGRSIYTHQPVLKEIARKLPLTAEIALLATGASFLIAIPLGVISAIKQDRWPDYVIRVIAIGGLAAPSFWVGILILLGLILFFNWSPPLGYVSVFDKPVENFQIILFPTIAVAIRQVALGVRMTRSSTLDVMRADYVRTARAKGLFERDVIMLHALKNAALPVITLMGMEFAFLFGGLIVTETVFNVAGLGQFVVQSVTRRDYPLVQGVVLTMTLITMVANLFVDLTYGWLDPRIRFE